MGLDGHGGEVYSAIVAVCYASWGCFAKVEDNQQSHKLDPPHTLTHGGCGLGGSRASQLGSTVLLVALSGGHEKDKAKYN